MAFNKISIPATDQDNFNEAEFSLRLPDAVQNPKFLLILLTGFNGDSAPLLEDAIWLDFAEEIQAAMIACTFRSDPHNLDAHAHYSAAQHGSGAALDTAIEQFAEHVDACNFSSLPLLIYGHSAGGQFAYGYSCHQPKRMLGFAAGKGGYYFPEPVADTYDVPGLLISGAKDLERRRQAIRELYEHHHAHGAPWILSEDNYGHEVADTLNLVIPFFRSLVNND